MNTELHAILQTIARRRYRQRLDLGLAAVWWGGLVLGIALWLAGLRLTVLLGILLPLLAIGALAVFIWSRRILKNPRQIARDIEAKEPALQTALLAAMDQEEDPSRGGPTYLQRRLIFETLATAERERWVERLPRVRLTVLRGLQMAGIYALLFALAALWVQGWRAPRKEAEKEITTAAPALRFTVDPGDTEIERGSPLTIQARFEAGLAESVRLEVSTDSGTAESVLMSRPFTDPVFHAKLPAVNQPSTYRVIADGVASPDYRIGLFDVPALKKTEAVLHFPPHLGKPDETLVDSRTIQAEELTRLDLTLTANLPGLSASLVAKDREPLKLEPVAEDPARYTVPMVLTESVRYEIVLTDAAGRRNSRKDGLEIKVVKNTAPVVEVVLPRKNDKATAIQEVRLEARVRDDSGLVGHGLRYSVDGKNWHEVAGQASPEEKAPLLSHLVDLEAIGAKPKDMLMWNAWAEDTGPGGKTRRVNGDIHLVRIRDFDEEFYQQAAPPGGGAGNPAAELIKTQTEILNATWGVRRDHTEITETPPVPAELDTLRKSQEAAIGMSREMEAEISDPTLRQILADARLAMQDAVAELNQAYDKTSAEPLDEAIAHEQEALRLLNQLASSKTMIMMGQGQGQSSSSEEKPKDDLDLKPLESPYQAEKTAKPETGEQAREAMETLQRLADLAKRQRDLNDEIQAMQMALKEAKTPEQQAEMERRLKQLRDQQKELLEDMDRLRDKTAESAKEMAEKPTDKGLKEAREKARQASEELEDSKLGEALAAGRRSQEALEKLEDEVRESSAAKLGEQLRELRREARELDERQKALAENSAQEKPAAEGGQRRLSESAKPTEATEAVREQREKLDRLTQGMRETAEAAERPEPLVANDLAEALRQADQDGISKALERMENPAAGPRAAAEQAAKDAGEGISKLTGEVEQAAERILGNEAQSLRYAREELERLAAEAGKEGQSEGQSPAPGEGEQPGEGKPPGEGGGKEPGKEGRTAGMAPGEGKEGQGKAPGEAPGEGKSPGEGQGQAQAEGKGQGEGEAEGQNPGEGQGQGEGRAQQAGGQGEGRGESPGEGRGQRGQGRGEGQGQGQGEGQGQGQGEGRSQAQAEAAGRGDGGNGNSPRGGRGINESAITNGEFREWSDRLHDLEAVLDDPAARAAVAQARRASSELRRDFKRHSEVPDEEKLRREVLEPLAEAGRAVDARLRKLNKENPLAPVGSDPVPDRYAEVVRRYFEELGK